MRKNILSTLILLFLITAEALAQGLKADGKYLVNDRGEKVLLRCMGLGGWMLQEGYMLRVGNIGPQYKIKERIGAVAGKENTRIFYEKWLSGHMRKIDIDSMAVWGFNAVRLPMHFNLYTLPVDAEPVAGENTWLSQGFALTDSILSWCKANKIYLILDLHATPGGQGNDLAISDRNGDKPSLWQSEANQQKMIALWRKLAERYHNESWIGGYDLINEPNWGFESTTDLHGTAETKNEPLRALMMDITKVIREVDKKHIIIIEGNGWGNNYSGVLPQWDSNMVLSFHKYWSYNNQASIQKFLDIRNQYNIPLWLGESGENSNVWFTQAIRLMEQNDIGWSWWPLKKIGNNNPLEIKLTPGYEKLVNYWNGKDEKPSEKEASQALMEFAENIKLENCIYHKDVIDAMFRQVKSAQAIPFTHQKIVSGVVVYASDYDLGRNGVAYFDKDSADFHVDTNTRGVGNAGHLYRNDGVDIERCSDSISNGTNIFHIENGEWLQYTIHADKKGTCSLLLRIANAEPTGSLSIIINNQPQATGIVIPVTGKAWKSITIKDLKFISGENTIRILMDKGGFTFNYFKFSLDKI